MQNDAVAAVEMVSRPDLAPPQAAKDLPAYGRCARRSHTRASPRGSRGGTPRADRTLRIRVVLLRSQQDHIVSLYLGHGIPVGDHEVRVQTERAHAADRRPHTQRARPDARAGTRGCNCSLFRAQPQRSARAALGKLPFLQILYTFIQFDIAFVTGFRNLSVLDRRKDGAALLLDMRAAGESALAEIGRELRKGIFQIARASTRSICSVSNEEKPGVSAI